MSRYNALKAIINQDITTNGQGDITGAILNQLLKDMVDSLGAYYQFGGIATPTTNPGNPDQRVFFIATIAGTYTNFDSMAVPNGISILKFDESWSLQTLDLSSYLNNVVADGVVDGTRISAITTTSDRKTPDAYSAGSVFTYYDSTNGTTYYYVALTNGTAGTSCADPTKFFATTSSTQAVYQAMLISSVIATEQQSFSPAQKEQAASNIGLGVVVKGDVQQSLSDDEQVQAQNNLVGKAYAPAQFSGLGKKVLAKNIQEVGGVNKNLMTQALFQDDLGYDLTNTVFVIQYDYTLSADITIPAGCTLEFDGGSIRGAGAGANTITGTNTVIKAEQVAIFDGITIAGTWNVPNIYSVWFSDISNDNVVKNLVRLSSSDIKNNIYMAAGTYNASIAAAGESILALKSNTTLYNSGNIVLAANAYDSYKIVFINNVENVKVIGGTYTGDMSSHTGNAGEWGHGISVVNSKQVTIDAVTCTNCWGDPLYLADSSEVLTTNFKFTNSGRNGCSIVGGCSNIELAGGLIQSIKRTNPKAAVDVEPSDGEDKISNVYVHDISIVDCPVGVKIYNIDAQFAHTRNIVFENILIDNQAVNCIDFENADGAIVRNLTTSSGNISVNKSTNISITGSHFYSSNVLLHAHNEKEGSIEFVGNVIKSSVRILCNINGAIVRNNSFIINGNYYTRFEHASGYTYTKRNILENNYFENNPSADNAVDRVVNLAISDVLLSDNTVSSSKKVNSGIVGDSSSVVSVNTKQLGTNITSVTNGLWSNNSKLYPLAGNTRPTYENGKDFGAQFYDISKRKPIWWRNNQWLDANGENPDAPHYGTWAGRPTFANVNRGFMYFNTDANYPLFAGNNDFVTALGFTPTRMKGSTAQRPTQYLNTTTDVGFIYLDQTLNKPIWWTGDTSEGKSGWVDATGADMPNSSMIDNI